MSRTFNDTPDGTFGQFVRAVPVVENEKDFLLLTGLAENLYSRTNLNLANLSSQWAGGVIIRVLNDHGEFIGDPVEVAVLPNSTTQIVKIAERAGIYTDLDIYSLYIFTNGHDCVGRAPRSSTTSPVIRCIVESVGTGRRHLLVAGCRPPRRCQQLGVAVGRHLLQRHRLIGCPRG